MSVRIVFMGNPAIANPILKALNESFYEIVGVVSNAPKLMGRGQMLKHTAIGELSNELNLNYIPAVSLKDDEFHSKLISLKPDIFVVVAFRILPNSVLGIPKMGSINLHTSLLPKYRGAAPIQHALLNGDSETGITTFSIEPRVDAGEILMQEKIKIEKQDDFGSLSEKMAKKGIELVLNTLNQLENNSVKPIQQDKDLASSAPKITKEMCAINWNNPVEKIKNQVRAFSPFPGAFTTMNGKRLKIYKSLILDNKNWDYGGKISLLEKNRMAVSCGDGLLELLEIQFEGKRRMTMGDCLKGLNVNIGDTIGT
jgi:methionyl-tRNA formyltransferase